LALDEFLSYHCSKTCLKGCNFSCGWCLSYFAQTYSFLYTERHEFSYRILHALSWLSII